jgi:hypothetical protein
LPGNETTAKLLGYAGLIPFVVFSVGSWSALPIFENAMQVLIAYAAIILSFMGAIHWGMAMSRTESQRSQFYIASVIPALIAWLALLMPDVYALSVLLAGFIAIFAYDYAVQRSQGLPGWYIAMRTSLTLIVAACLTAAIISI